MAACSVRAARSGPGPAARSTSAGRQSRGDPAHRLDRVGALGPQPVVALHHVRAQPSRRSRSSARSLAAYEDAAGKHALPPRGQLPTVDVAPEAAPAADFWAHPFTGFAPVVESTNGHDPETSPEAGVADEPLAVEQPSIVEPDVERIARAVSPLIEDEPAWYECPDCLRFVSSKSTSMETAKDEELERRVPL